MTFDIVMRLADTAWHCLGQVRRSRS